MAEAGSISQFDRELDSQLGPRPRQVDSKTAKKAIAKATKFLRGLQEAQKDRLVQSGLLADKDTEDVVKALQEKIAKCPSLLWNLISQISSMPGGEEAAKKLHQGESDSYFNDAIIMSHISYPSSACCPVADQKPRPTLGKINLMIMRLLLYTTLTIFTVWSGMH